MDLNTYLYSNYSETIEVGSKFDYNLLELTMSMT